MPNIEDIIKRAVEDGKFDDLQGRGKPLSLYDNPHVDPQWRMAHHLVKSSGYTLPWIGTRQEILQSLEAARTALARSWSWRQEAEGQKDRQWSAAQIEADWQRAVSEFTTQVDSLNKKIFSYNLEVPSDRFQLLPVNIEREIAAITQAG